MSKIENQPDNNKFTNRFGLIMALAFYIVSVVMVMINTSGSKMIDPELKTITIGHWQLEDGFRQGMDQAIKDYEKMKAAKGEKVKVIQSTVPGPGYQQWFATQLISGDPADIIELRCSSQMKAQYMEPLASYIATPNPYNKGTPLQGIPWKDTFVDGMNSAFDSIYANYFGVGTFFHVTRVYVNKKLLKEATGSTKLPKTFDEWMDTCRKIREYGEKKKIPLIPIGMSGTIKSYLTALFMQYFSQLNGHLNDSISPFCCWSASTDNIISKLADESIDRERLLEAVDLMKEIGTHFSEGFITADEQQMKFLFFAGKVGFYIQGTWDAWSMINNSPFDVAVINIPVIGPKNRYYKNFTGQICELGVGVGGLFGIPKSSKHFELALDFLRYMTSYNVNQMMMNRCKWPPAVIKAKYEGVMQKFKPVAGDARKMTRPPFYADNKSMIKMVELLEQIINNQIESPRRYFWNGFTDELIDYVIEEQKNAIDDSERRYFDIEGQRNSTGIGLAAKNLSKKERSILQNRAAMGLENLIIRFRINYERQEALKAEIKIKEGAFASEESDGKEVK